MSGRSSVYLNEEQREFVHKLQRSWLWRTELPTWLLIITIYGGWFATVAWWKTLGLFPATLLLIWFSTWYMSLQHELLHGHPTRFKRLNQLFGLLPFSIWYPYGTYRDLHLKHHQDEDLTVPETDPESYYFTRRRWQHFSGVQRVLVRLRNTFPGRLLLTPILTMRWTVLNILESFRSGNRPAIAMWIVHLVLLVPVLGWLVQHDFSVIYYLLAITWPMLAMTKVRSFFEHRAAEDPEARTVINEAGMFWRLLFLNLNYHSVHHDLPRVPWYGLPTVYRAYKEEYLKRNQGFFVNGYGELMREHLIKPIKVEINPFFPDGRLAQDTLQQEKAHE
ncbi:fatty acid desaturase [Cedecea sp. FDAARGOS_727]|uniref:fatty acid desaturase n=1 Tax=Cedecea sp. FDAARGOS_727 TaxID=2545798 RepID=UPI00143E745F|nr:fatty acid desaturase [Cedecea sp. FDAARGOS_727]QIX96739.1 fatty acid desaturase [Cedecea sp. FDAARGOS_727]